MFAVANIYGRRQKEGRGKADERQKEGRKKAERRQKGRKKAQRQKNKEVTGKRDKYSV